MDFFFGRLFHGLQLPGHRFDLGLELLAAMPLQLKLLGQEVELELELGRSYSVHGGRVLQIGRRSRVEGHCTYGVDVEFDLRVAILLIFTPEVFHLSIYILHVQVLLADLLLASLHSACLFLLFVGLDNVVDDGLKLLIEDCLRGSLHGESLLALASGEPRRDGDTGNGLLRGLAIHSRDVVRGERVSVRGSRPQRVASHVRHFVHLIPHVVSLGAEHVDLELLARGRGFLADRTHLVLHVLVETRLPPGFLLLVAFDLQDPRSLLVAACVGDLASRLRPVPLVADLAAANRQHCLRRQRLLRH